MALYFTTTQPAQLLARYKKMIDDKEVETWSYDQDGDFTHTPDQWRNKAWLRPVIETGRLAFYVIKPNGVNISTTVYSVYHGRFIESMLAHCDTLFTVGQATALPAASDKVA